jgi:hypothetical protein
MRCVLVEEKLSTVSCFGDRKRIPAVVRSITTTTQVPSCGIGERLQKMTNDIGKIREWIDRELATAEVYPDEHLTEVSPCGRYELEVDVYATADARGKPSMAVAVVTSTVTGETIATLKRNDDRCFYAWVHRDGHDYLVFPEDLEGQSVVDLAERRVQGFSSQDDPFIWAEIHPSRDGTKLAVIGCYWACPYQVTVYDFTNPMALPLPKIAQFDLPPGDALFGEWVSADSFSLIDNDGSVNSFDVSQPS